MEAAIKIVGYERCIGCSACVDSCPQGALEINISNVGFYIPKVADNCVNCGVCQKYCPIINIKKLETTYPLAGYAAWNKDEIIRISSSSGGVFFELAKNILEDNGIVYGVIWDDKYLPRHVKVMSEEQLWQVMGSKYVQSNLEGVYKQIIQDTQNYRRILFSGTPCQIAAVRLFAKNHYIENIITVDLICFGVSSLKIYKMYLDDISGTKRISSINMRNKKYGWSNSSIKIEFNNGSSYESVTKKDWFFRIYLSKYAHMLRCYNCPFARLPRLADITIGDFWGIDKKLSDERGVSAIIINTENGLDLIKRSRNLFLVPSTVDNIAAGNPRVVNGFSIIPKVRNKILKNDIKDFKSVKWLIKMYKYQALPRRLINKMIRIGNKLKKIILIR